jgi:Protein of unknown function (DUF2489)
MSRSPENSESGTRKIVEVARAMLSGDLDLIEGARRINQLRFETADPESDLFLPIRGFESETADYPMGAVRDNWAAPFLAEQDRTISEYVERSRKGVLEDCRRIVDAYSEK